MTPAQVQAILTANRRRTLLEAADQIPHPEAATWLREKAEKS